MKRAEYWRKEGEKVICELCPHHCSLREGQSGICNVRIVSGGELMTLTYGNLMAMHADPIEKKPLFHFLPGSRSLSIATAGCNLQCVFCQNWSLSQVTHSPTDGISEKAVPPESIVEAARKQECASIAYTYSEPTIFFEYARDTARLAHSRGIANIFVTNGYIESSPLQSLHGLLHAANVDLKAFSERTYRKIMGGELAPVLNALKQLITMGVWVEVTTLVIPTVNDSSEELRDIARFIREELNEDTPWHVSRFHPDYQFGHIPPTPASTLRLAREIGLEEGLNHVYTGNLPGDPGETTYCQSCGRAVIKRTGFVVRRNMLREGACPHCERPVPGVWSHSPAPMTP
ncbi:MAG TPA: AmmeMemoRadiSam system radical SAM enzyme [Thermoanaerobaculia bacterium]|nr:AmmeMemoRadiSam system radical SAM enzyme [Thermoanaerobaculia bacterium]HUM29299.1 AmmeMemoRadiSam system radical SAM enzyme [Thermoanaerobaculia bacterium]HXK67743.1 AmmeMemoRadiSam system radical SAM enzyme [Thermoanaerobaculia bacterium]